MGGRLSGTATVEVHLDSRALVILKPKFPLHPPHCWRRMQRENPALEDAGTDTRRLDVSRTWRLPER